MPDIIPLSEWYPAMASKVSLTKVPWEDRTHWVHHHTVGGAGSNPLSYARLVADMHYDKWRVPGGYGVLVGTDGVLRAMCGLDGLGVHAGTHEWNRRGVGLAFQGDFRNIPPSDVMLDAARGLIAAHPLEQTTHRAVRPEPTSCPGQKLIDLLPLEDDMPTIEEIREAIREETPHAVMTAWVYDPDGVAPGVEGNPFDRPALHFNTVFRKVRSDVAATKKRVIALAAGAGVGAGAIVTEIGQRLIGG